MNVAILPVESSATVPVGFVQSAGQVSVNVAPPVSGVLVDVVASRAVDILLLDHVIVGVRGSDPKGQGYFSFREAGVL